MRIEAKPGATEEQVRSVEESLGFGLPSSYRAWIMQSNGGGLGGYAEIPDVNGLLSEIDSVDTLPGLRESEDAEIIPDEYLRVTMGHGGSLTIKVQGDDHGSVWWASFSEAEEKGIWEGPSQEIMHRLADDWDAFLAMDFESD